MIYIDKCRTDLGVTVDEWAVDDRCRFSDSGKVGIGTGVRVFVCSMLLTSLAMFWFAL